MLSNELHADALKKTIFESSCEAFSCFFFQNTNSPYIAFSQVGHASHGRGRGPTLILVGTTLGGHRLVETANSLSISALDASPFPLDPHLPLLSPVSSDPLFLPVHGGRSSVLLRLAAPPPLRSVRRYPCHPAPTERASFFSPFSARTVHDCPVVHRAETCLGGVEGVASWRRVQEQGSVLL